MSTETIKSLAKNRKARHEFFIEEAYEVGMVLTGTEVKSIRKGRLNLKDSYAEIRNGEVFVSNLHISPYEQGNINNVDPTRTRKLLLHKKEISKLIGYTQQKGLTLIPLEVYLKGSHVKMQLAVARGKKLYDKRHDEADRDAKRNMERAMKTKY
jgi:SsrA-binding protein